MNKTELQTKPNCRVTIRTKGEDQDDDKNE